MSACYPIVFFIGATTAGSVMAQTPSTAPVHRVPTSQSSKPADKVHMGATKSDIERGLGRKGDHQFTAHVAGADYRCVSYSFKKEYIRYYFVFNADHLISILEPAQFFAWEETTKYSTKLGSYRYSQQKPWDAEERLSSILRAKTLSEEEFTQSLSAALKKESRRKADYDVLPAFIILAPLLVPSAIVSNLQDAQRQRQFDPLKVKMDMTMQEVESALSKPLFGASDGQNQIRVYGPKDQLRQDSNPQVGEGPAGCWIVVVFHDGKVTRVYTHDLFNTRKLAVAKNRLK